MAVDVTSLLEKLIPDPGGEDTLRLRTATVATVNADGTVDLTMSSGVLVPGVPRLSSASVSVGNVVQVISLRGSLLVIGTVAGGGSGGAMTSSRIATTVRTSSTSVISSETVANTVTADLVIGKVYKVTWYGGILGTVAGDSAFIRIRENNLAGSQLQLERVQNANTGGSGSRWTFRAEVEYTAVATGAKTFAGTYARATGSGDVGVESSSSQPAYLYVDYVRG
jgi:hypothetical protein